MERRRFPHGRNSTGQVFGFLIVQDHEGLETSFAAKNLSCGRNPENGTLFRDKRPA
jgi:hypothetical protein